jgi:hypothetical protein
MIRGVFPVVRPLTGGTATAADDIEGPLCPYWRKANLKREAIQLSCWLLKSGPTQPIEKMDCFGAENASQ